MKKIAILQSSYIPWKGYFDIINFVDEFILYDDVKYTKSDWRSRNLIKTPHGKIWLTIPVRTKGRFNQKIKDATIADKTWAKKHWKSIKQHYNKAPAFNLYREILKDTYERCQAEIFLSRINFCFIKTICGILGIKTQLTWSMEYDLIHGKTERLVDLCRQAKATHYVAGPTSESYIKKELFDKAGISLIYYNYSRYPEYEQLYFPFDHHVSVVDLILNTGRDATGYMKSFTRNRFKKRAGSDLVSCFSG